MSLEKYPVKADEERYLYEFYSEGLKGYIKKTVIYSQIEENLFNLAFGDWNEETNKLDDSSRTNNGDRAKVLATVAYTVLDFSRKHSDALIFLEGSTAARTRLYQMEIAGNLFEIDKNFEVKGLLDEHWEPFQKGKNYNAFLVIRK